MNITHRINRSSLYVWTHKLCKRGFRATTDNPEQKEVRELLVSLMGTGPSKRELRHFLKRFDPQEPKSTNISLKDLSSQPIASPKEYVNALLAPSYHQLALTKIEGPFEKSDWQNVANTLHKLQKLGLSSIVVPDNPSWTSEKSAGNELVKQMLRESMALVESIDQAGGRARLIYGSALERSLNGNIEINLDFILSALNNNQIPILVPTLTEHDGQLVPVKANQALVALTQRLANQAVDPKLVPSKIVVINKEGGIPNHALPGTAHSLVNVQEEYEDIEKAFSTHETWKQSHPNTMQDLTMIRDCLDQLPTASSAIIVPTSSLPSALITNLVTDKPLYSSSLPVTHAAQINQKKTTVLRHGIKINTFHDLGDLNLNRLTSLLEASFQRKVNTEAFYSRLDKVLAGAIIAGDYEGAVIMTDEKPDPSSSRSHAYLDKFAIAPSSQGIGLTDILWKRMCDNYPELLWRSRKDNGVNKWYFERSNGFIRLKDSNWVLFWHGAEGHKHAQDYAKITMSIPPSFMA